MKNNEKASWELTLKNILYYVEDTNDQEEMLGILNKYNDKLPDGKLKDSAQKFFYKHKKSYYEKVDFLIDDILSGKGDKKRNEVLSQMLQEIKPTVEKAEKSFWDKLTDLFKWS